MKKQIFSKEKELALGRTVQNFKKLEKALEEITNKKECNSTYFKIFKKECDTAVEILYNQYKSYAYQQANQMYARTGSRYEYADLIHEALAALIESIYSYDPSRNCRLSTHAFFWMRKRMSTQINYNRTIRMPENMMGKVWQMQKAEEKYSQDNEDLSLDDYVHKMTGIPLSEILLIRQNLKVIVPLDAPIGTDENKTTLGEQIVDSNSTNFLKKGLLDNNKKAKDAISKLSSYERDILSYEFNEELFKPTMPYHEFQDKYKLTEVQIQNEYKSIIRKLKKMVKETNNKRSVI